MATKVTVGKRVQIPKARLSYAKLFRPDTQGERADNKYKGDFIINKKEQVDTLKMLKAEALAVAKQAFGPDTKLSDIKHPFKDGDAKGNDEYKGSIYITPKSKYKPQVVMQNPNINATEGDVYDGCHVRVSVVPISYDVSGTKGVTFRLGNVQKVADDAMLGGGGAGVQAASEFDTIEGATSDVDTDEDIPF